ncbi:hypothetical protein ScPMuIL_002009 [Solemya velum]
MDGQILSAHHHAIHSPRSQSVRPTPTMITEHREDDRDECHVMTEGKQLDVVRFFHTNNYLDELLEEKSKNKSCRERICSSEFSGRRAASFFRSLFPVFDVIRTYKIREYLVGDLLSGISVGCLHLPKGIAFGMLASLAPAYGLYTSFFPLIVYTIFGTSPHVSFATNAVIAILISEIVQSSQVLGSFNPGNMGNVTGLDNSTDVLPMFDTELEYKASAAAGISLFVGLILLLMGVMRLGVLTTYLSTSFISGFTTAAAFHIATSQIPRAFGVRIPLITGIGKLIHIYHKIALALPHANIASVVIFICCLLILLFIKDFINERFKHKLKIPIPIDLILIVIMTIVSHYGEFNRRYEVRVVGTIPSGIPAPTLPHLDSIVLVLTEAFVIAILIFAMTIAIGELCAKRHGYEIDENQELIAYGLCNFISSFFLCFPSCVGPPRSMVLSDMGVKTTLNNIVSAVFILLVLMVLGQLFVSLPVPMLAAMIIVAVTKLLLQVLDLKKFWRVNKYDFATWVVTFLTGVLMDLPYGLLFGIVTSFITVIVQSQRSSTYVVGKMGGEDLYVSVNHFKKTRETPGVKIFRMETSLYFATAVKFEKRLFLSTVNPKDVRKEIEHEAELKRKNNRVQNGNVTEALDKKENDHFLSSDGAGTDIKFIILDCMSITYVDYEGVETLSHVIAEMRSINITVYLARCNGQILNSLAKSDFYDDVPRHHIFVDIPDALAAARASIKDPGTCDVDITVDVNQAAAGCAQAD